MDRKQKREVVTALVKAGRRDLAEKFVGANATEDLREFQRGLSDLKNGYAILWKLQGRLKKGQYEAGHVKGLADLLKELKTIVDVNLSVARDRLW